MYLERSKQAGKLEVWAIGTRQIGPHVGIVGPKSMLASREIDHLRGGGVFYLIF